MKTLIIALKTFLFMTILTGIIYPLFITGIAQLAFPARANGSMIYCGSTMIGSKLIGQESSLPGYFWSRPSAVSYNPLPSGGSNDGLTNAKLKTIVTERRNHFITMNHLHSNAAIPSEMLFASASGLDPHISPGAALLQVERIAGERHLNAVQRQQLEKGIRDLTEPPQFLCLGEERINVLLLNLRLDRIK